MAVSYRFYTYSITEKGKDAEKNTIQNILRNNEYDTYLFCKLHPQKN
jgi:hypothetical protein